MACQQKYLSTFILFIAQWFICQWTFAICHTNGVYDMACLRTHYHQPINHWQLPVIDDGVAWTELAPIDSPIINNTPLSQLGQALFFETALSADGMTACVNCHNPNHAFADARRVSLGVHGRQGRRNSQSLTHLGMSGVTSHTFFWDGRADSLTKQVLMPLTDPNEMDITLDSVPIRLTDNGYLPKFQQVFGQELTAIDIGQVAQALTAYLHTLSATPTRFDEFLQGRDNFTDNELLGLHLFRTKARCMNCHFGQGLTDGKFHNLNQTLAGRSWQDFGRYEHTHNVADFGKFKTPSLRGLSLSRPWFHHGLFTNLRGVVAIYNAGMPLPPTPDAPPIAHKNHLDPLIKPLQLTNNEMDALTAFLLTL